MKDKINYYIEKALEDYPNSEIRFKKQSEAVRLIVRTILDDFENRTCSNCKHDCCGCSIQDSLIYVEQLNNTIPNLDDFGCNKFKEKEY